MAIAAGDTVILDIPVDPASGVVVRPEPPLRGRVNDVAAGAAGIIWENGLTAADVSVNFLRKLAAGAPSIPRGSAVRIAGSAQEMIGILADVFITESDAGNQRGLATVALIGRGDGSPAAYAIVALNSNLSDLTNVLQPQLAADYPRY